MLDVRIFPVNVSRTLVLIWCRRSWFLHSSHRSVAKAITTASDLLCLHQADADELLTKAANGELESMGGA